jgi:Winged helix DNA-binding domain
VPRRIDPLAIVRQRLRRQRLVGRAFGDLGELMRFFCATQGQEFGETKWSLGQRLRGVTDADLEAAFDAGEILRTHVMRPTWHLVAPDDIRWLLELTAPRVRTAMGSIYRKLGLGEAQLARGHRVIDAAVADGEPRIRAELYEALAAAGFGDEKLRLGLVIMDAELEGLICSGPRRGSQQTYAPLDQRAPNARRLDEEAALAELTRRYFQSHSPATLRDLSWWSGLTMRQVRHGAELVGNGLVTIGEDEDGTPWYSAPDGPGRASVDRALLLSMYDESTIAYRELRIVPADRPMEVAFERPLVIGGVTVATWKPRRTGDGVEIVATLFDALDAGGERALEREVRRLARFLGRPVSLAATAVV